MSSQRVAVSAAVLALLLAGSASAKKPKQDAADDKPSSSQPAADSGGPRRDPKGIKGISPFWEAIKKGDDAYAARDFDGAKTAYEDAIRAEPQNPMGHYRMGEVELAKGNLKDAETAWQSALRFAAEKPAVKAKVLFVLADLKERARSLEEATNGWNAYETNSKGDTNVKTYPATPADRKKRITDWQQLETDYAAVKERIKQRLEEAEKKAAESAQSPRNR
jgi:tetratricopeptide (TPR) repeat protein